MSERPTPETDSQNPFHYYIKTPDGVTTHYVPADFARKLERERDEAIAARKASAADWLNQIEQANARVSRACRERDCAKARAKERLHRLDQAACERRSWLEAHEKMRRERDEAREQLRLANIDCFAALTELDAAREKIAELLGKEAAK